MRRRVTVLIGAVVCLVATAHIATAPPAAADECFTLTFPPAPPITVCIPTP